MAVHGSPCQHSFNLVVGDMEERIRLVRNCVFTMDVILTLADASRGAYLFRRARAESFSFPCLISILRSCDWDQGWAMHCHRDELLRCSKSNKRNLPPLVQIMPKSLKRIVQSQVGWEECMTLVANFSGGALYRSTRKYRLLLDMARAYSAIDPRDRGLVKLEQKAIRESRNKLHSCLAQPDNRTLLYFGRCSPGHLRFSW